MNAPAAVPATSPDNRMARLAKPLRQFLQQPWLESIVRFSAIEDTLRAVHPLLSLAQVRARVVRVIQETADCKTFILQPNALWQRNMLAGQYVRVRCEINGRRVERVYSLSSAPGARRIAITVKRQNGGKMSEHLHAQVGVGSVLELSQAMGEFVLLPAALREAAPAPSSTALPASSTAGSSTALPERILLLSAGSGITPVMAMLRDLQARHYRGSLVFLHACRDADQLIFARELREIAALFPDLRLQLHFSREAGRLSMAQLQQIVPDLATRATWVCGPESLMHAVQNLWQQHGWRSALQMERFVSAPRLPASAPGSSVAITCASSGRQFATHGTEPLLVQAERAGLQPKHGCRIGICRSCQCVKRSGTVENLQSGEISSEPDQLIRLCISAARSDLRLDI